MSQPTRPARPSTRRDPAVGPARGADGPAARAAARDRARAALAAISDEEDAALTAAAERDPDSPPRGDEPAGRLRPAADVAPEIVRRARGQRGPQKAPKREPVTLRLDPKVVAHFRATGPGWQGRINEALKKLVGL